MRIIGTHEEIEKIKRKCSTISNCKECCLTNFCRLVAGAFSLYIEVSDEKMDYIEANESLNFDISLPTLLIQKGDSQNGKQEKDNPG